MVRKKNSIEDELGEVVIKIYGEFKCLVIAIATFLFCLSYVLNLPYHSPYFVLIFDNKIINIVIESIAMSTLFYFVGVRYLCGFAQKAVLRQNGFELYNFFWRRTYLYKECVFYSELVRRTPVVPMAYGTLFGSYGGLYKYTWEYVVTKENVKIPHFSTRYLKLFDHKFGMFNIRQIEAHLEHIVPIKIIKVNRKYYEQDSDKKLTFNKGAK